MASYDWVMIGLGGHARVLADVLRCCGERIHAASDPAGDIQSARRLGAVLLADDAAILDMDSEAVRLVNGVGSTGPGGARRSVYERFTAAGFTFPALVHPSAVVAADVVLAPGAQVMAGAVLQPGVRVGENAIINTGALIDHDCSIGAHAHVAPGATLSGGVQVGETAHVGVGAAVVQGTRIAPGTLVKSGSLAMGDATGSLTDPRR